MINDCSHELLIETCYMGYITDDFQADLEVLQTTA